MVILFRGTMDIYSGNWWDLAVLLGLPSLSILQDSHTEDMLSFKQLCVRPRWAVKCYPLFWSQGWTLLSKFSLLNVCFFICTYDCINLEKRYWATVFAAWHSAQFDIPSHSHVVLVRTTGGWSEHDLPADRSNLE